MANRFVSKYCRPKRKVRKSFFIVTEGEVTEPEYFRGLTADRAFRAANVDVVVQPWGLSGSRLVEYAAAKFAEHVAGKGMSVKEARELRYAVYAVFDKDALSRSDFDAAVRSCKKYGVNPVFSSPSFEVWLSKHFGCFFWTTKRQLEAEIARRTGKPFSKRVEYGRYYSGKAKTASSNAKTLRPPLASPSSNPYLFPDPYALIPYTTVDLLVDEILWDSER